MRGVFKTYGFFGLLRLLRDILFTRLFFPGARIIRQPYYFRGKSRIRFGRGFTTGVGTRLDVFGEGAGPRLVIGSNVQINDYVHIAAIDRVEIGDSVLIASRVFISDHNHGRYDLVDPMSAPWVAPSDRPLASKPVIIGRGVWIGEQVCILPGVSVGEGAIVGAGSVVTKDVPARSIVVGSPARVVRVYDEVAGQWMRP